MINRFLLIAFAVAVFMNAAFAKETCDGKLKASIEKQKTTFVTGENAFVSVFIEGTGNYVKKNGGAEGYTLENIEGEGNASWLSPDVRPKYDPEWNCETSEEDKKKGRYCAADYWINNQYFWIELSGEAKNAGDYNGKLRVRNTKTNSCKELSYNFRVNKNDPGLYIVSHDAAASYPRQIEFYSRVVNNTGNSVKLDRPYMDYYLTKMNDRQLKLNFWGRPHNSCVQVLECGNNHYVVRQRYKSEKEFSATIPEIFFQLGIQETKEKSNS